MYFLPCLSSIATDTKIKWFNWNVVVFHLHCSMFTWFSSVSTCSYHGYMVTQYINVHDRTCQTLPIKCSVHRAFTRSVINIDRFMSLHVGQWLYCISIDIIMIIVNPNSWKVIFIATSRIDNPTYDITAHCPATHLPQLITVVLFWCHEHELFNSRSTSMLRIDHVFRIKILFEVRLCWLYVENPRCSLLFMSHRVTVVPGLSG